MLHSLILTDLTTGILKLSFDTTRPNGKSHGFPSGHTASSFAVAAVVEETYGEAYGILAYTFAGLVAWHRIDNRNHDLSDVIFGACLGTVIGKSVSSRHLERLEGVTIRSYSDPEQGLNGIEIEKQF
jgi:membrane-associated phospholipid phosphatase